ncbi:DNA polymerase IV [Evansella cellulosilytica]|uniref:DNA polymerase IV n=1 Tax=Evansella cellulosilytica (strain ATCC 21833 / DSM 2522 / FERM P-1141 / JCM 9156 / N-4) TaxID=649639 RepID=E6TXT6_EVAC2|nr:DNA polymerase IV [Evansella cellulosilytica]ADU30012.1 DNA-directed DNA polymerase [Evansella cellulosilytica DSM 2522]
MPSKIIFHVDMNSFYASVEAAYDSTLMGKPVAIAGNAEARRGIVVTSSYEARARGVKPPMPLWEALKKCPELVVREPNFERYRHASKRMFQLLYEITPLVEPVSIDEGYLDVTDVHLKMQAIELAKYIQTRIKKELNLPCSIGVAPNKFLAKMASDMKKPMGITILRKREVQTRLWPLKAIEMHGIGAKTADKLNKLGIHTIEDIALSDPLYLKAKLGIVGERIHERANGIDQRPVDPLAVEEFKSIGNSTTLPTDSKNVTQIKKVIMNLSDSVGRRIRNKNVYAGNIQITIRYSDFSTITRSSKLHHPVHSHKEIFEAAWSLWQKYWSGEKVRLIGVTAMDLVERGHAFKQLDLFSYKKDEKEEKLSSVVDTLKNKFGENVLLKGTQLGSKDRSDDLRDKNKRGTSLEKDFLRKDLFHNEKE